MSTKPTGSTATPPEPRGISVREATAMLMPVDVCVDVGVVVGGLVVGGVVVGGVVVGGVVVGGAVVGGSATPVARLAARAGWKLPALNAHPSASPGGLTHR